MEKGASSWFRAEKASIHVGDRAPWANWREFAREITAAFSAIKEEEQARKQLKSLSQTGSVQNYIQHFRDLKLRIPSMSVADTYAAFMDGLKPAIYQQIAPHIETLQQAQTMAVKVDLYSAREGRETGAGPSAGKGGRGGGKSSGQKGKLGTIGENPQPDSVATVAEKKKLQELKKKSNAKAKQLRSCDRRIAGPGQGPTTSARKRGISSGIAQRSKSCGNSVQALREMLRLRLHALPWRLAAAVSYGRIG